MSNTICLECIKAKNSIGALINYIDELIDQQEICKTDLLYIKLVLTELIRPLNPSEKKYLMILFLT